jgi:hypothetical protein
MASEQPTHADSATQVLTGCWTPNSPSKELTTAFALGAAFLAAKPAVEAIKEAKITAAFMVTVERLVG